MVGQTARDPEPPTQSARGPRAARALCRDITRLEVGALVLFVPAYHVRAAGWRRVVLLTLQVAVDRVAEDFRAARVSDNLDAAADAVVIRAQVAGIGVVLDVAGDPGRRDARLATLLHL